MWAKSVIPFSQFLWFWDYSLLFFSLVFISQVLRLTLYEVILGIAIRKEGVTTDVHAVRTYFVLTKNTWIIIHGIRRSQIGNDTLLSCSSNVTLLLFSRSPTCLQTSHRAWYLDVVTKISPGGFRIRSKSSIIVYTMWSWIRLDAVN